MKQTEDQNEHQTKISIQNQIIVKLQSNEKNINYGLDMVSLTNCSREKIRLHTKETGKDFKLYLIKKIQYK